MVSGTASADEPNAGDKETSRNLGVQGMRALDAHDYAAAELACGGAYALVKAPTVATCWARALEGLGRLLEARDVFVEVTHQPTKPDEPPVFTSAREAASVEADSLAKRIPTVTLVISGAPETTPLHVTLDGLVVKSETARLPRKVDPGQHTLLVSALGFVPTTAHIAVGEGENRRVEVTLASSGEVPRPHPASDQEAGRATNGGALPVLAIVAGSVGLAGLVVGVTTGVAGSSKHSTLSGECNTASATCPPSAASDLDAFHSLRTASTVGYVVGALGLVAGGVIFFVTPSNRTPGVGTTGLYLGPSTLGLTGGF
jgi:hypothetical protein